MEYGIGNAWQNESVATHFSGFIKLIHYLLIQIELYRKITSEKGSVILYL